MQSCSLCAYGIDLWKISLQILPEPSTAVLEYLQWVPASPGHIPANAVPAGVGVNGMTYPYSNVCARMHAYMHIQHTHSTCTHAHTQLYFLL